MRKADALIQLEKLENKILKNWKTRSWKIGKPKSGWPLVPFLREKRIGYLIWKLGNLWTSTWKIGKFTRQTWKIGKIWMWMIRKQVSKDLFVNGRTFCYPMFYDCFHFFKIVSNFSRLFPIFQVRQTKSSSGACKLSPRSARSIPDLNPIQLWSLYKFWKTNDMKSISLISFFLNIKSNVDCFVVLSLFTWSISKILQRSLTFFLPSSSSVLRLKSPRITVAFSFLRVSPI